MRIKPGALNHPAAEEWMAYLYEEVDRAEKARLDAHLKGCRSCRAELENWRQATGGLRAWTLTETSAPASIELFPSVWRWAAAALVVLGLGCVIGRYSAPAVDRAAIQAALEKPLREAVAAEVRREVQQQLVADCQAALTGEPEALNSDFRRQLHGVFVDWRSRTETAERERARLELADLWTTYENDREEYHQSVLTLFDRAERQWQKDKLELRRSIETVAVVAADKFQRTESQLGQLASYTEAKLTFDDSSSPNSIHNTTPKGN